MDGTGTVYGLGTMFTMPTNDVILFAEWNNYGIIGDIGPAGGVVFYDKGAYSDFWRYIEAAPKDTEWIQKIWGGYGIKVEGTDQSIGSGLLNTEKIVAKYGENEPFQGRNDYAAKLCYDLEYGGYKDWFLPSITELEQMISIRSKNQYYGSYYWSSTEVSENFARCYTFTTNDTNEGTKNDHQISEISINIRAARMF